MIRQRRPAATHLFLGGDVRVFAIRPSKLAMYDVENKQAWISSEDPLDLHDWR